MRAGVSYRHNVMNINSIDTFLNVKGGFNNNVRDVYFVRGLGEPDEYAEKMADVDRRMREEMLKGRLTYLRLKKLPPLSNIEDLDFYSGIYEQWKRDGKLAFRNLKPENGLEVVLEAAYADIIKKYKTAKKGITESITRNFATKILYWLDDFMGDSLKNWNERRCIKIIAENVLKEQEYLFCYFLTLCGCDVFLIERTKDIEIAEELKQLSAALKLGAYGSPEAEASAMGKAATETQMTGNATAAHETATESKAAVADVTTMHSKTAAAANATECKATANVTPTADNVSANAALPASNAPTSAAVFKTNTGNAEKSFEELAQLASSIVMIAVHDKDGDILGTGSGIMIGRDGYILTNNHVASGGRYYSVRIEDDNERYTTDEVIKYNYNLDLAVIRINRKLKPLPIYRGGKKLVRGQKVVAIGSPLGLFNSVSDGIISGFRNIENVDMIQFTAPISHGSSGGAVLNMQGEVIGISTAGIDTGQNINLAVGYENILMFAKGFYG